MGNMMSGMDPRLVKMAMKKMGIKQEDVGASRVIIETLDNKKIIINNPIVQKIDMAGNTSFQISGDVEEENTNEADIEMIMEQTNKSREKVKEALEKNKGDIARTILDLK
ncbi:MAG: nascent polypeptide-associated complex protein [Nanoarchaeota archaeon]|nr:nascent polypeptide-associated complex protein [Nanoarchaeota archaeon]